MAANGCEVGEVALDDLADLNFITVLFYSFDLERL